MLLFPHTRGCELCWYLSVDGVTPYGDGNPTGHHHVLHRVRLDHKSVKVLACDACHLVFQHNASRHGRGPYKGHDAEGKLAGLARIMHRGDMDTKVWANAAGVPDIASYIEVLRERSLPSFHCFADELLARIAGKPMPEEMEVVNV